MKKILILFISLFSFGTLVHAQGGKDIRTNSTRIADFLRQLPASNHAQLGAAMEEVAGLDEAGLISLVNMLVPVAKNKNAKIEYAISGFSGYVTMSGREAMRTKTALAYSKALATNTDPEARSFVMSQIEWIGQDESVPYLSAFLADKRLVDPASRALVGIGSQLAQTALVGALSTTSEENAAALLEAVGKIKAQGGLAAVTKYAQHSDANIRKTALYALASLADPSSASLLSEAASKNNYQYDVANSFAAYLDYIHNLNANGNKALAEKLSQNLLKETAKSQTQARVAALEALVDIQGQKSLKTLAKASKDQDKILRVAALKLGEPFMNTANSSFWLKQIKKGNADEKAELITLIGDKDMPRLIPILTTQLKSSSPQVKLAAIKALGKLNGTVSLPSFLSIAQKGNAEEVSAVTSAILSMKGNNVSSSLAKVLPSLPKNSQVAFLSLLGSRAAKSEFSSIYPFLKNNDAEVRNAAFQALTTSVGKEQLPQLFSLLNETNDAKESANLQKSIMYGLREIEGVDKQTDKVVELMATAPSAKKPLYYDLLGSIGGGKALIVVEDAFVNGDAANRAAALQSLSSWKEEAALPVLYKIVRTTKDAKELNSSLNGLLRLTNASSCTADQKVIILKDAMQFSQTDAQKKAVLRALSAHKTFPALAFAGQFINNPDLAQQAATAVMDIALANLSLNGDLVKQYLNTTIEVLKGQDSEYLREAIRKHLSEMNDDKGFVQVFNGKDLTGWKGLVDNPILRREMDAKTLATKQEAADRVMREGWQVQPDGELLFLGKGDNIATVKHYGNIEMWVDWKIYDDGHKEGDAGIYLKGAPQVQIWDVSRVKVGAQVGSGGLYNNKTHESKPLVVADNPLGDWNSFYIKMVDDKVTVYLNGVLVTDNVLLENYWNRNLPLYVKEQIELQAHGSRIGYRDIYIKELPTTEIYKLTAEEKKEGFKVLFDGTSMDHWTGNTAAYSIVNGEMVIQPSEGSGGNLYTKEEYTDFVYRFEFKLTEGANNGLGVRTPTTGDAAYEGIEIQILDNTADIYKNLKEYQYHGSLYGIMTAKRGYLKPLGEWNYEEVIVKGDHFKVILNGTVILDGSIADAKKNGALDGKNHPGLLRKSGRIAFLGHGSKVYFKNIRVKRL